MKKWKVFTLAAMIGLTAVLGGCSSSGKDQKAETSEKAEQLGGEIKITDEFTFTDPEDIEYDTRYVYRGGPECGMLSSYSESDIGINDVFVILYANGETAVAEYQYYVFADEASEQAMADAIQMQGAVMDTDGLVGWIIQDADVLEANIASVASFGLISDETASAYTEIYTQTYELQEYTGE